MSENKKTYYHVVRESYCKGCNICVAFCPKQVLALKNGKVFAQRPDQCIGCLMCELRCPDFAIEVKEQGATGQKESGEAMIDHTIPPEAANA